MSKNSSFYEEDLSTLSSEFYGRIYKDIIKRDGFSSNIIENYNNEMIFKIPEIIMNTKFESRDGIISFENVRPIKPTDTVKGKTEPLYPREARMKTIPYFGDIVADVVFTPRPIGYLPNGQPMYAEDAKPERKENFELGSIPVMLGSQLCHLHGLSEEELLAKGECIGDPFGYFIIKSERIIITQSKLRVSAFLIYNDSRMKCTVGMITCPTEQGRMVLGIQIHPKYKFLRVIMQYMLKNNNKDGSSIFLIFKVLGVDVDKAIKMIKKYIPEENHEKADYALQPSIAEFNSINAVTQEDYIEYIKQQRNHLERNDTVKIEQIIPDIVKQLFCDVKKIEDKLEHLAMYSARMVEIIMGTREIDDRDSWGSCQLETPGKLLTQLFKEIWAPIRGYLTNEVRKGEGIRAFTNTYKANQIKDNFVSAFGPNAWGSKNRLRAGTEGENITESLKRDTPVAIYSQITKVTNSKASRESKDEKLRMVHPSQLGFLDLYETPDGEGNGLVKNLAASCYISLERDPVLYQAMFRPEGPLGKYIYADKIDEAMVPFLLNGKIQGWCIPNDLIKKLKAMRKNGSEIQKDVCIFYNDNNRCVEMFCDGGRPTRPLFVVDEDQQLVVKKKRLENADIPTLIREGCIEYIDAREQEYITISERVEKIEERNKRILALDELLDQEEKLSIYLPFMKQLIDSLVERYPEEKKLEKPKKRIDEIDDKSDNEKEEIMQILATNLRTLINDNPIYEIYKTSLTDEAYDTILKNSKELEIEEISKLPIYDYCEIDPNAMFSPSAAIIPMSNRQAGPRTGFQCVEENTLVTMGDGTRKPIRDIKNDDIVMTVNPKTHKLEKSKIKNYFNIDSTVKGRNVYEIKTLSDRTITVTGDHQFLTTQGWKEAEMLKSDDLLLLHSNTCVLPNTVEDDSIILTEEEFVSKLKSYEVKENIIKDHLQQLKDKGLIPLRNNDKRNEVLSRIYGHILSDGGVFVYNNIPRLNASVELIEDINEFEDDIESLGFVRYNPCERISETGNINYSTSRTGPICSLMISLDAIVGSKNENKCNRIHKFIMNGSKQTKREFLASYQGGDGCRIRWSKTKVGKYTYIQGTTLQHKVYEHLDSLYEQMTDIKTLFEEFNIKASIIKTQKSKNETFGKCEIQLSNEFEEHIKYMDVIGFRYCRTKHMISAQTTEYLKYKISFVKELNLLKKQVLELYNNGMKKCDIKRKLNLKDTVVDNFIRHPVSEAVSPFDFMKIDEWCNKYCIIKNNILTTPIKSITLVEHCRVCDFTTESDNHSFIANDFVTHNCGMNKQALTQYHSNEATRFDASYKMLYYPTRALFQTDMQDNLGLNRLANGQTITVAIIAHPDNPEDGIVFKEEAIKYGCKFDMAKKQTTISIATSNNDYSEHFQKPEIKPGTREGIYDALDDNGIPRLDAYIRQGDCIIGKIRKYNNNKDNPKAGTTEEIGEYAGVGEEGFVDRVLIVQNVKRDTVVKVKIRKNRKYIPGDKLASRYSQKGTVSKVVPARYLPRIADGPNKGLVPDIIINPYGLLSRMTMNKIIEVRSSKAAVIAGRFFNATTFRNYKPEDEFIEQTLEQHGLDTNCDENFILPDGTPIQSKVFFGPCHYQALRHHVSDKIQMRAKQGVKPNTRQPVSGRSKEGGLKVGEMERDALISHGSSALLRERLMDVSDAYTLPICSTCGTIAITDHRNKIYKCNLCREKAKIGTIRIPYVAKLLLFFLNACGIHMTFTTENAINELGRPEERFLV